MSTENYSSVLLGGTGIVLQAVSQDLITFILGGVLLVVSIIANLNANRKHTIERKLAEKQLKELEDKEKEGDNEAS